MKRFLSLFLVLVMFFSFAACGKKGDEENQEPVSTTERAEKKGTAKISIPLAVIEKGFWNDLDKYCETYGYESAKLNEKTQTVTVKMDYMSYRLLLTQMGMEVIQGIYKVLEDGTYKYFKDIESYDDKNFGEVVILVNQKSYENDPTSTLLPFTLAQTCFLYQMYTEAGIDKCDIIIKNAKTKEVIETKTYTENDV